MGKMKAVVKTKKAPGCVELRSVDIPSIGPDEVLIKVHAAGVCGTDIGIYNHKAGQIYYPPVILGHEFSGTICEMGSEVANWKIDDPVVAEPQSLACGLCVYCRRGEIGMCPEKRSPGWGTDGGMAEYIAISAKLLHRIPPAVDLKTAALTEPLAVAVHAMMENTSVEPGDVVVVMGAGPIGVLSALLALTCGVKSVVLIGTNADEKYRLPDAAKMGIPVVLNVETQNPESIVLDLTEGIGADMVVDACGAEPAINLGLKLLRKKGRFVATGIAAGRVSLDWNIAVLKNISCYFQYSSTYTSWSRSLRILESQRMPFSSVISETFPLDCWGEAFEKFQTCRVIKALLCP